MIIHSLIFALSTRFEKLMMKFRFILPLALILLFFSCDGYQRVLKSSDYKLKEETALKLYEKKDYKRAVLLFEELLTVYRGNAKAERLYFMYAYSHYGIDDYAMGAYYFENFISSYPGSSYAEEAAFMLAYCLYMDSPRFNLDPTTTLKAIEEFQFFVNRYPKSKRVEQCNQLIEELRGKLEKKTYQLAVLYYNTESYQAAIIAFKNLLKDYPDTKYYVEAAFYTLKASYSFAVNSVDAKKKARLDETLNYYYTFVDKYSKSRYMKEAEQIFILCNREIDKLNKKKS